VPLAHHSILNLCGYPKLVVSKRQKMSFKISYGCSGLGSGCFGLRYRFGNPRLIVIANEVKQSQKEFPLSHTRLLRALPIAMTLSTEGEAVPAARFARRRPPHPSRNSPPSPLFLKKRGAIRKSFYSIVPPL